MSNQAELYGPRGNVDWSRGPLSGETFYLGIDPPSDGALYALKGYNNRKEQIWAHWAYATYEQTQKAFDVVAATLMATRDESMDEYHNWSFAYEWH